MHVDVFHSDIRIEQPLIDLPLIGGEQRGIETGPILDEREERGLELAGRVGDIDAVVQREVDQLRILGARDEFVVPQPPMIVGLIGGEITAHGQLVAGKHIEGETQVIGKGLNLLLHDPESHRGHVGVRIQQGTGARNARGADQSSGAAGREPVRPRDEGIGVHGRDFGAD